MNYIFKFIIKKISSNKLVLEICKNLWFFFIEGYYSFLYIFQKKTDLLNKKNITLFIDHNLGGGTTLFRKNFTHTNTNIITLSNVSSAKKNICFIINDNTTGKAVIIKEKSLFLKLQNISINEIIINSLVSYINVFYFLNEIHNLKLQHTAVLRIMIHDYYPVCLSFNLMNNNCYCNINCSKNKCKLFYLDSRKKFEHLEWRKAWGAILSISSEIRCFSSDSKKIFSKAYPNIDQKVITVKPHSLDYITDSPLVSFDYSEISIGIIGDIGAPAKGSLIIKEFLRFIHGKKVPVTIIGNYSNPIANMPHVKYLGPYDRKELKNIIQKSNINVVFFPSVCPETFSYLISELIVFDIPIVCFDLGSQAEKIKNYYKGYICSSFSNEDIYNSLINCYESEKKNAENR